MPRFFWPDPDIFGHDGIAMRYPDIRNQTIVIIGEILIKVCVPQFTRVFATEVANGELESHDF